MKIMMVIIMVNFFIRSLRWLTNWEGPVASGCEFGKIPQEILLQFHCKSLKLAEAAPAC